MTTLCIQIQPDRVTDFDREAMLAACESLRVHKPLIEGFQMEEGDDDGPYINLLFETLQPAQVWPLLQTTFYGAGALGDALRATSMAMCAGEEGWEDYLLLYHYDPQLPLDSL
ncbi:hypothetical protein [Chitinimonas sp.]|uniref:hypothetical protein n=1 Tax=Chitinimonas sp. TaxID=1934313 RepID=UPI002F944D75